MRLPIPRLHLFEIDDQPWLVPFSSHSLAYRRTKFQPTNRFPPSLRAHVQSVLTLMWTMHIPFIQPCSPATLVARKLLEVLGDSLPEYTVVDFCSGAGGPTCEIERVVNNGRDNGAGEGGMEKGEVKKRKPNGKDRDESSPSVSKSDGVDFILTDLHPHISAWGTASRRSPHLRYVPSPIDASAAPSNLLSLAEPPGPSTPSSSYKKKQLHIFSLAFHHFPDPLARRILRNTLATSHAFAIFELQSRTLGSIITILTMWPMLWAVAWWCFWGQLELLFWIYVLPVVPFVVVFDGLVSSLRTRWGEEVERLMVGDRQGWKVDCGGAQHTWPCGDASWVLGTREAKI